ncbi:hypothetical protein IE077_003947 [Cardiosporidium cionae]|uniref:Nucleoporin p58/p45 n=1 Tax=Cardiosporidium cionae TaxID=476202 RepID=A0ABQ7JE91_9APIC|nr:hypothetical protein IE077_003947 [Cardiosporidium cionae]|eukprot:KAF8822342.1 hypothetical protein IE077_003947 [Cardiosporidium cionae]
MAALPNTLSLASKTISGGSIFPATPSAVSSFVPNATLTGTGVGATNVAGSSLSTPSVSYLPADPTLQQVANFFPSSKPDFERIEECLLSQEAEIDKIIEAFLPLQKLNKSVQKFYESEVSIVETLSSTNLHIDYSLESINHQITWSKQITAQIQRLYDQVLHNLDFFEQDVNHRSNNFTVSPLQVPTPLTAKFYQDLLEMTHENRAILNSLEENVNLMRKGPLTTGYSVIAEILETHHKVVLLQSDKILRLKHLSRRIKDLMEKNGVHLPPFDENTSHLPANQFNATKL